MVKSRKFSRHKKNKRLDSKKQRLLLDLIENQENKPNIPTNRKSQQFNLTEDDRITYVYEITNERKVVEVVDVSYEHKLKDKWFTVIRYDSEHGYLHRHSRIEDIDKEIVTTIGVKKKGDAGKWLTWAIKDISTRYENYKRGFLKKKKYKLTSKTK